MNVAGPVIGRRIRHLKRYREVAQILVANGFGWFISELGLTDLLHLPLRWLHLTKGDGTALTTPERIRSVLEALGPTFVKLGQLASVRRDLLPKELVDELAKLQDDVAPQSLEQVKAVLEAELGCTVEDVFASLHPVPVGSASIGQVHRGTLHTGEIVAVKVQRPGMERRIRVDLEILADLAGMAERRFDWAQMYRVTDIVEELRTTLLRELDYQSEGRNADRIRACHKDDTGIRIPRVIWEWTSTKVLVMEFLDGVKLTQTEALRAAGHDPKRLAERAVEAVLSEMLRHGVFHADPHPGNLAALPSGELAMMDFGMVGHLTPELQRHLAGLVIGLMRRDSDAILRTLYRMGVVPDDVDAQRLRRDVDALRDKYYESSFHDIRLAEATGDLFSVAYRHRILIPPDLTLVGKTLMTLEGVVEQLAPDFRMLDIAEPFGRQLLRDKLHPRNVTRQTAKSALEALDMLMDLPQLVRSVLRTVQRGRVKLALDLSSADGALRQLTRIANRISLTILLLALSIFLSGLMVASALAKSPNALWSMPMNDVALGAGAFLVLVIIWSIARSGRP